MSCHVVGYAWISLILGSILHINNYQTWKFAIRTSRTLDQFICGWRKKLLKLYFRVFKAIVLYFFCSPNVTWLLGSIYTIISAYLM